ncbi:hypothetical protein ACA910_007844 [Epithemia clementina (nom. ined.)]
MLLQDLLTAGYDPILDNTTSWCPVADWSVEKFQWCIAQWRNITNFSGGNFVFENDLATETDCPGEFYKDEELAFPIPFSSGPTMFSYGLYSHDLTLELLEQTREICDNNSELHCWMSGIPYDYWSQYEDIFRVLMELSFISAAVGFGVSWIFLLAKLASEKRHSLPKVFCGSLIGALLITLTVLLCLLTVIGLSVLADVSMTGFSNMSFVLSVAFSVEYSVHIVSRWLRAPNTISTSLERVQYTMSFLMLPTFMSWVSSTIGVVCMAFTDFEFTSVYFFRPLIIVMMVTYFFGCYTLPALLSYIDLDICRLGKSDRDGQPRGVDDKRGEELEEVTSALELGTESEAPQKDAIEDEPESAVITQKQQPQEDILGSTEEEDKSAMVEPVEEAGEDDEALEM